TRRKREIERKEIELTSRMQERDLAVSERERRIREEAEKQLAQLSEEQSGWKDRQRKLAEEEDDLKRQQTQLRLQQDEIDQLRDQIKASINAPLDKSGQADPYLVQSLVDEWVFGFAHQVRNPLGIIRSMTETLRDSRLDTASRQSSLGAILKAV